MNKLLAVLALLALAGCAGMPAPPSCDGGAKRPINSKPITGSVSEKSYQCGGNAA